MTEDDDTTINVPNINININTKPTPTEDFKNANIVLELESNYAKILQKYNETVQKLELQVRENEMQRKRFEDYQNKAQRALAAKDSLLLQMKNENSQIVGVEAPILENNSDLKLEYESLCIRHSKIVDDFNNQTRQLNEAINELSLQKAKFTKLLQEETQKSLNLKSEQRVLQQELTSLRQQLSNQLAVAANEIQEKEQHLQQLLSQKKTSASDVMETLEFRLKSITESLVHKQKEVESITADRNALRIQLEKIQAEFKTQSHKTVVEVPMVGGNNDLHSNTTDDSKM